MSPRYSAKSAAVGATAVAATAPGDEASLAVAQAEAEMAVLAAELEATGANAADPGNRGDAADAENAEKSEKEDDVVPDAESEHPGQEEQASEKDGPNLEAEAATNRDEDEANRVEEVFEEVLDEEDPYITDADAAETTEEAAPQQPKRDGPVSEIAAPVAATVDNAEECDVCGQRPRIAKQRYCGPCRPDVRAAERDAGRQGAGAKKAFANVKKVGGDAFKQAMEAYRQKCQSHGRGIQRPSFDWVRYYLATVYASRSQQGMKAVWFTRNRFIAYVKQADGLDDQAAEAAWTSKVLHPTTKKDKGGPNGQDRILYPIEEFVMWFNEQAREETVQWGCKDIKDPGDDQISDLESALGHDHPHFNSDVFGQHVPESLAANQYARPLPSLKDDNDGSNSPDGTNTNAAATASDKGKGKAKGGKGGCLPCGKGGKGTGKGDPDRKRKFDPAGVLSALQSQLPEAAKRSKDKAAQYLVQVDEKVGIIKKSMFEEGLKPALELLQVRRNALQACLTGPDAFRAFKEERKLTLAAKDLAKDDKVTGGRGEAPSGEVIGEVWLGLDAFETIKSCMLNLTIESPEDEKKERARAKAELQKFDELAKLVKDQLTYIHVYFSTKTSSCYI